MTSLNRAAGAYSDSKSHYVILDGLRGVAAILVVIFHVFEIFAMGDHNEYIINHGYLAVDFFFALSGFVIGYAYDDRWQRMSLGNFFKRRLIRLHPMIIMGMLIGAICFYFSASPVLFPGISEVPVWQLLLVMLVGFTLLPLPVSMDIRGWTEMHPLDGPAWTLFFEYIANILYALILRKLPNVVLAILMVLAGAALVQFAVFGPQGDVIGGWALNAEQLRIGFTRLLYPFLAGLLLSRIMKPTRVNHAFLWCSLLMIVVLAMPRIGTDETLWMNGLYESLVILLVFPFVVWMGASGEIKGAGTMRVAKFLGDISYPIYIIHYPIVYVFMAWVVDNEISVKDSLPVGFGVLVLSVVIAYASLRLYDIPVRKWLTHRLLLKQK